MEIDQFAHALLEAAPDAVLVVDATGIVVRVNAQLEALLGYGREELVGTSVDRLVPEAERLHHARWRERYNGAPTRRRMGGHALEVKALRRDGSEVPVEITLAQVRLGETTLTIAVLRDLSDRRKLEEHLLFLSTHDTLTGLANRSAFDEALTRLDERGPHPIAVVMVDLDGLKRVNDQCGHAAGDALLRRVATVLKTAFRSTDFVARIGGDEFAVLAPGRDVSATHLLASRVQRAVDVHNESFEGEPLRISLGIAVATTGVPVSNALQDADARMYEMKREHHER